MNDNQRKASLLIIEEGARKTTVIPLEKDRYVIGRDDGISHLDIYLTSDIVSRQHGVIFIENGQWYYQDFNSVNGIFIDGRHVIYDTTPQHLQDGMVLRIDGDQIFSNMFRDKGVLIVFNLGDYVNQQWENFPLNARLQNDIVIGRHQSCNIVIGSVSVSQKHGVFKRKNNRIYYQDLHSRNGTMINGIMLKNQHEMQEKDVLLIGRVKMIYVNGMLLYLNASKSGGCLSIQHLTKEVNDSEHFGRKKKILNDVNVEITASELVAVLGTSGAGKSTFLNCVNGYEEATSGMVKVNGLDLYKHKKVLKKQIGYVPQEDLLRDGLSVKSTLKYIAKMRLPKDVSRSERLKIIDNSLDMLGLETELKTSKIRKLSGGQRKRVSIASELISDPPLLFLDEPTSGLDPETETNLIVQLRKLAHDCNKTLIVITHTLKNIALFDKILFLGPGGKACYYGSPEQALALFEVDDIIDMYPMIREQTDYYAQLYKNQMGMR